ncbi:hypothetical protein H5410_016814 [Solanum commersonii]|uniref:Uncharacterized protein n=1 Tax=Solanum commersonii TaxID=4109 RepID=A0A9J5ZXD7_SOLCO|nr:hypothetical protein H5410_016814 [Solanum commersonii]
MQRLYVLLFVLACVTLSSGVDGIGVNYGFLGNNLPPPAQVINLLKSRNFQKTRIFDPNPDVLKALEGSCISLILGVRNEDLQQLASDLTFATNWVNTNVVPHVSFVNFAYISAGNEVIPGQLATFVLGAMQNLDMALKAHDINIPVTTTVSLQVLGTSYPPSNGSFSEDSIQFLQPIAQFLATKQYPLLADVYPYFAYASNPDQIQLDYALIKNTGVIVVDGDLRYNNLFDAMVDALYAALEKVGQPGLDVVISETGWPSGGDVYATIYNAQTYVNNLIAHVASGKGTPRKPGKVVETYIFALFNENQKPVACMGGVIFGYDIGISGGVTSMEPFLKKFFHDVYIKMKEDKELSNYCKVDSELLTSFTSSLYVAGLFATFVASSVTRAYGRKASILLGGANFFAGAALGGAASNIYMLIIGRVLLGVDVGFANQLKDSIDKVMKEGTIDKQSQAVPLYLSDMAPSNKSQELYNVIAFYAHILFRTIGLGVSASLLSSVVTGAVGIVTTGLSMLIVDKVGRRGLLIFGGIQMFVTQMIVGALMGAKLGDHAGLSKGWALVILVLICTYVAGFGLSWGPLGWLIPSEIFPLEIRSVFQYQ